MAYPRRIYLLQYLADIAPFSLCSGTIPLWHLYHPRLCIDSWPKRMYRASLRFIVSLRPVTISAFTGVDGWRVGPGVERQNHLSFHLWRMDCCPRCCIILVSPPYSLILHYRSLRGHSALHVLIAGTALRCFDLVYKAITVFLPLFLFGFLCFARGVEAEVFGSRFIAALAR